MDHEIIKTKTVGYSVSVAANKIVSLRKNYDERTTVRVYDDGYIGVAGVIGKADTEALRSEARKNLTKHISYPCMLESGKKRIDPPVQEIIPAQEIVPAFESLLTELSARADGFLFGNKINLSYESVIYENSRSTFYHANEGALEFALTIKDKNSPNIMDMVYATRMLVYDRERAIQEILEMISAYESPVPMPEKKLPVVIEVGDFLSPVLSHFTAELYASGASLFSGKIGQKIFGDGVDLLLDRNKPYTQRFFDAEGVVCKDGKHDLIRNGVLQSVLTTKRTAQAYSLPLAGCAESAYDGIPQIGVRGLRFGNAASDLAAAGESIFIVLAMGGDMTPTGDMGIPVQLAFLLKDGKFIGRLPELMLSGNIFDLLGRNFRGAVNLPDGTRRVIADFAVNIS